MAPLLKIFIQWLPTLSSPSTLRSPSHGESIQVKPSSSKANPQQQPVAVTQGRHGKAYDVESKRLSTVSWGKDHVDVFGFDGGNLTHKYWDGHQWSPSSTTMETLGQGLATPPVSVSWGENRLDVFGLDEHGTILHQYWDGTAWKPHHAEFEELGYGCDPSYDIDAGTWGPGHLDIFCNDPHYGQILHQYYDGHQWSELLPFGVDGDVVIGPKVVSWGENHMAVFFLDRKGQVNQRYWDGSQWSSDWVTFTNPKDYHFDTLTVSSWGEGRLDVWAAERTSGLWHLYWDGYQWSEWECLSGSDDEPVDHVAVASWSANHFDVVVLGQNDKQYRYKYYDGASWQPSTSGWYGRPGVSFDSAPSVVSWGPSRLDVFGMSSVEDVFELSVENKLLHQAWTGYDWYPGTEEWETLSGGDQTVAESPPNGQQSIEVELRY
ncbi:MAG: hypothetical protein Q9208_003742 [Pyrenodesmia sp. 3 TL-2023]